jgi:hypothetical protein
MLFRPWASDWRLHLLMARNLRNGRRFAIVVPLAKEPLPDEQWRKSTARAAVVVEEGQGMIRRLFALLDLVGDRGVHVSAICEILATNTTVIDPLISKLARAGRVKRQPAPRQFAGMGCIVTRAVDENVPA